MPASASVRDMDEAQLQEKEAREATAGFEQVQQIMTQMLVRSSSRELSSCPAPT
jgi:hypothetical protein